jgi:mycothiol S-conjugate amidase
MSDLCLLTVHAHPDDEASKGAGTVARYHDEGVRTVLVCCTGGEEGDIHNPAMDRPEVRERLLQVRMDELAASASAIGYDEVALLGYRDSGMPDAESNNHPESFWAAPIDEAVEALVGIIRAERPQVIVTYGDDQSGYPHPDHLRVHDISVLAFEAAGEPGRFPDAGAPWKPTKLYYTVFSRARLRAIHDRMLELGIESPFDDAWWERPSQDDRVTTRIEVGEYYGHRKAALLSHATQIDPTSPFWFGLPDAEAAVLHPWDDYVLARSRVESDLPESDLFAGVR